MGKQELLREPEIFLEQKSASEIRILNFVAKGAWLWGTGRRVG